MRTMRKMNAVMHVLSAMLFVVMLLGVGACEGETNEDSAGVDAYFDANPHSSEVREEAGAPDLTIDPVFETISIVGETIVFTGNGGTGPYTWTVGNSDYGHIETIAWSEAVYTCDRVGNNDVILQDQQGHSATAHITPVEDAMTISPSSITLAEAYYAAFAVSGGTPPYTWSVGNSGMGAVSYSADTSHLCGYTAVVGTYGVNVVTVTDAEDRTASATVEQTLAEEE